MENFQIAINVSGNISVNYTNITDSEIGLWVFGYLNAGNNYICTGNLDILVNGTGTGFNNTCSNVSGFNDLNQSACTYECPSIIVPTGDNPFDFDILSPEPRIYYSSPNLMVGFYGEGPFYCDYSLNGSQYSFSTSNFTYQETWNLGPGNYNLTMVCDNGKEFKEKSLYFVIETSNVTINETPKETTKEETPSVEPEKGLSGIKIVPEQEQPKEIHKESSVEETAKEEKEQVTKNGTKVSASTRASSVLVFNYVWVLPPIFLLLLLYWLVVRIKLVRGTNGTTIFVKNLLNRPITIKMKIKGDTYRIEKGKLIIPFHIDKKDIDVPWRIILWEK